MSPLSEEAFKDWLTDEGVTVPIYTGLTGERIPNAGQHVHCYAQNSEHVVGPLYKCDMVIVVQTSPNAHEDEGEDFQEALDSHRTLSGQVQASVEAYDSSDLETIYEDLTGDSFSGLFVRDIANAVNDGRWVTTITLMFGTRRGGAS